MRKAKKKDIVKSVKDTRCWGRTQVCKTSGNTKKLTGKVTKSEKGKEKGLSDEKKRKEYISHGSEMICKVRVKKKEVEALINTGSEVSLAEELKLVIDSLVITQEYIGYGGNRGHEHLVKIAK